MTARSQSSEAAARSVPGTAEGKPGFEEEEAGSAGTESNGSARESERVDADEESAPELAREEVAKGLSKLGRTADGRRTAFLRLELEGVSLRDCRSIAHLQHVQEVKICGAGMESLDGLESLPSLLHLDVSDNRLSAALEISPAPRLLRSANLARNDIAYLDDLTTFSLLRSLDLSHNQLDTPGNMGALPSLEELNLSHNQLVDLAGVDQLKSLTFLDVSHNYLDSLDEVGALVSVCTLRAASNRIAAPAGLERLENLRELDLSDNRITSLEALVPVSKLPSLHKLGLSGNECCDLQDAHLHVAYLIPQLVEVDGNEVTPHDKVHAQNMRGADLTELREIRGRILPHGELDDYGGTTPAICVPLEADDGALDLPEKDCAEADDYAAACPPALLQQGVKAVASYLFEEFDEDTTFLRGAYHWVLSVVEAPEDAMTWSTSAPLLRPELEEQGATRALLPYVTGAWAERVAALLVRVLREAKIMCHEVHGYIKPLGFTPGDRLEMPNHCWVSVRVGGRWRVVDPAWAAVPGATLTFFTRPEDFVYTHLPLLERWQLLEEAVSVDDFWDLPQLAPAFFSLQLGLISRTLPHTTNTGTVHFQLLTPHDVTPFAMLAKLPDRRIGDSVGGDTAHSHVEVLPRGKGVPAGGLAFIETSREADGRREAGGMHGGALVWNVYARLPDSKKPYCICLTAARNGEQQVDVMTVKVQAREDAQEVGRLLPAAHPQWLFTRCALLSPKPTERVVAGESLHLRVVVPDALIGDVAVGEPGGYLFTLLEHVGGDVYEGSVVVPAAPVLVVTCQSVDNPGVYAPLLKFRIDGPDGKPFRE
ncbi:unnamed protein product [Pedinophyceae sp. YPF-701]|nr:unnamed protein product [Pedinophyceae sp. YPF-701]